MALLNAIAFVTTKIINYAIDDESDPHKHM